MFLLQSAHASPPRAYLRANILHLEPRASSDEVVLSQVEGLAALSLDNGPVAGSGNDLESATVPTMTVGVYLPWLDGRIAIETILAAPITVHVNNTGTLANEALGEPVLGILPTGVPPLGKNLGTIKFLPPTLTAILRLFPPERTRRFHPYIGAGVIYLYITDTEVTNEVLTEIQDPELRASTDWGAIAQVGMDIQIYRRFFASIDIKYMLGLSTEAVVDEIYVATPDVPLVDSIRVGDATVDIGLSPLILQAGIGANF